MNISSSSSTYSIYSSMLQQSQSTKAPSASELSSKVLETSDLDADSLLAIDEINLSEETFSSFDEDGDGFLSSSEIETSFESMLENMQNQTTSPEEFSALLTNMGLDVPAPPPQNGGTANVSDIASEIFSKNDTDQDGVLSVDELDMSDELLSNLELDEDGNITKEELTQALATLFEELDNGEVTKEEVGDTLTSLGVEPLDSAQGASHSGANGGGGGGESSSSEEYDEADLNEDGIVTDAEQAEYDGIPLDDKGEYTMQLVNTLMDALKEEGSSDESIELSKFKSIMSMVNNETQDSATAQKLNTYVSNLDLGLKSA